MLSETLSGVLLETLNNGNAQKKIEKKRQYREKRRKSASNDVAPWMMGQEPRSRSRLTAKKGPGELRIRRHDEPECRRATEQSEAAC